MTAEGEGRTHPKEGVYIKVALWLAAVTAIEIGVSYTGLADWIKIAALLSLSVIKFGAVVAYFMHLKFDHPLLRRPLIAGIVLAGVIYTIVLLNMLLHSTTVPGGP